MRQVKLKKQSDGVIRSVIGSTHESIRFEIVPSKSDSFCGYRTDTPRYELIMVYRERDNYRLSNDRGDGSWSLGSAKYWAKIYMEHSFDGKWRLRWFGEET